MGVVEAAAESAALVPVPKVKKSRKDGRSCAQCGATESFQWHFKAGQRGPADPVYCHNTHACKAAAGCADYRKKDKQLGQQMIWLQNLNYLVCSPFSEPCVSV